MNHMNISGNTFFVRGGTNSGYYVFSDGSVLVIDPGHTVQRGHRISALLEKQGLVPRYAFITHEHFDHFEAFEGIKMDYPKVQLIAHENAKPFVEHLYLGMAYLGSSTVTKFFGRRKEKPADNLLEVGRYQVGITFDKELVLMGQLFEVHHIPGHCPGQTLIITPDRVCFFGDGLLDQRVIDEYDMPYVFSVEQQIQTLNKIKTLDFDYGVIAHSNQVYTREEIDSLVDSNLGVLMRYEADILRLLKSPRSREDILVALLEQNQMVCNYSSYHYNYSTVGAFLAKLANEDRIDYEFVQSRLCYFVKG